MPILPPSVVNISLVARRAAGSAKRSSTFAGAVACVVLILATGYSLALFLTLRYQRIHPRPLNKKIGLRLQRYAPGMHLPDAILQCLTFPSYIRFCGLE